MKEYHAFDIPDDIDCIRENNYEWAVSRYHNKNEWDVGFGICSDGENIYVYRGENQKLFSNEPEEIIPLEDLYSSSKMPSGYLYELDQLEKLNKD